MPKRDVRYPIHSATGPLHQPDHQRRFLPQHEHKLLRPPFARCAKLHVKMPEHAREDAADFRVRETAGLDKIVISLARVWFGGMVGGVKFSLRLSDAIARTDGE